ncbi:hypothetical protein Naga_100400g1, partial [Nannochloropsis gaditana]
GSGPHLDLVSPPRLAQLPQGLGAEGGAGVGRRLPFLPPFLRHHRSFFSRYLPSLLLLCTLSSFPPSNRSNPPHSRAGWFAFPFDGLFVFPGGPSSSLNADSTLAPFQSFVLLRHAWPVQKLEFAAASPDFYHRVAGMYFTIAFSLSTLYLNAYCMYHRISRRRTENRFSLSQIMGREILLLLFLVSSCEASALLHRFLLHCIFSVLASVPAAWSAVLCPSLLTTAKEVGLGFYRLGIELMLFSSLLLGPALGPQDLGILGTGHLGGREGGEGGAAWENRLQAMALTRFSLCAVPRGLLELL